MISFKQFLQEKAMNSREFRKVEGRQSTAAQVGFEFECIVTDDSPLLSKLDDLEAEYIQLRYIDTPDEIAEYFDVKLRTVEADFESWKDDQRAGWIEDNIDSDVVDEEGYDAAEEAAGEAYDREFDPTFVDFLSKAYGSTYEYVSSQGYDPRFGWASDLQSDRSTVYTEEEPDQEDQEVETFKAIATDLAQYVYAPVLSEPTMGAEHYARGDWIVVPDSSISPGEFGGVGAEINSPPQPLRTALKDLQTMFKWMEANSIETNDSTGLHINISLPGIKNVDPVKLVLFLGDQYVLKKFDRLNNAYTPAQTRKILSNFEPNDAGKGTLPREASALKQIAYDALEQGKYASVNLKKLEQGYLEFRMAGGAGYHRKFDQVRDTVLRFVSALEIAVDPEAEKNEYYKKLVKILGKAQDQIGNNDYLSKPLREILEKGREDDPSVLQSLDNWIEYGKKNVIHGATRERVVHFVNSVLLMAIFRAVSELYIKELSEKQKVEFKLILKKLSLTTQDLQGPADPWKKYVLKLLGITK